LTTRRASSEIRVWQLASTNSAIMVDTIMSLPRKFKRQMKFQWER
jgi:hypothetical protein